jgi:hypothetical protein
MHNYGSAVAEHDAHPYLTQKITAESDSLYSFLNNPLSFNNTHFLGLKYYQIRMTASPPTCDHPLPNLHRKEGGFEQ